jgi:hypothetical protein
MTVEVYAVSTGRRLGTFELVDGRVLVTGLAQRMLATSGLSDVAAYRRYADGWSNGYVATRDEDDLPEFPDDDTMAYLHTLFDDDGVERFTAAVEKVEEGAVGRYRARHLIRWYEHGGGAAKIGWGAPGDFDRCVAIAGRHMRPDQAKGFCNVRHHGVLGFYPATHAAMDRRR